jgi:aminoglycoside phosphotransferase (APT) family kinase protein
MPSAEGLPEVERNALLRRVDWRFLLRREDEPAIVSFASGFLARAVEAVLDQNGAATEPVRSPDLAVVVNPRRRSLRAASTSLVAGGEIYAEWRWPKLGGPLRARRRLESAGFTDVRCYWPWPRPDRMPHFWLPVDAPRAIEWFLRSRRRSRSEQKRGAVFAALWRTAARLGLLAPLCSVARKPGGIERTAEGVGPSWEHLGLTRSTEHFSSLLLTGGHRSINKVVALVFDDRAAVPRLVVKFARSQTEEEPLRREARTLRMIEETLPSVAGVPRVVFLEHRCGRLCLGESFLSGEPLLTYLTPDSYAQQAVLVTERLVELAGDTRPQPRHGWWDRLVEEPVAAWERSFREVLEGGEATQVRAALSALGDLALVCEHRDTAPWNILVGDTGELALVDWESSEPSGLPALDLVYFLTYAAFLVDGALASGQTSEAYVRSLDPTTFTGGIVARCERLYCDRVGLDPNHLHPLRLLCWVVHCRSDYRHLELDAAAKPGREALRNSLFLRLVREELHRGRLGVTERPPDGCSSGGRRVT